MSPTIFKNRVFHLFDGENVGVSPEASVSAKIGSQIFVDSNRPISIENLYFEFYNLYFDWKSETLYAHSILQVCNHPAYQQIIGLGKKVLPFIFSELKRKPDHWFWALKAITQVDPVNPADRGNLQEMTKAWLKWAEKNEYKL